MADHTITLSAEQETALQALIVTWQGTPPAAALTTAEALARIINEALTPTLMAIEAALAQLTTIARQLPETMRAEMLQGLTAPQQAKLSHLLPTPEEG